jgi:hypothetical protein
MKWLMAKGIAFVLFIKKLEVKLKLKSNEK